MRAFENIIAIICVVILLSTLLTVRSMQYTECCETTAQEKVTSFLTELTTSKELSLVEYEVCADQLYRIGYEGELCVTVTEYEVDVDGNIHQYVTTWDEIFEILVNEGTYKCKAGSCVKVSVTATSGDGVITFRQRLNNLKGFIKTEYVKGGTIW